jgi:FAD/FMN-containing dehydrogenase
MQVAVEHAGKIRSPHSAILIFQVQGALGELAADHTPVGNRDAAYVLNIAGSWDDARDDAANIGWARACFEAARASSTGGTYVNFLTEEEGSDRVLAAYGAKNLERLARIKRERDPANFFRHAKPIAA